MTAPLDTPENRTAIFGVLAAFLLMVLIPLCAFAQVSDTFKFRKYVESEAYLAWVGELVAGVPEEVLHRCPAMSFRRKAVKPLKFVGIDANGVPKTGSWVYQLLASGCDDNLFINLYFDARGDGKVDAEVGPPGTTAAAYFFPYDDDRHAIAKAAALAVAAGKQAALTKGNGACPQFRVKDTEFKEFGLRDAKVPDPGETAHFRPWWEYWAVVGCGHRYDMPMEFSPGPEGIKVSQPQDKVVEHK